MKAVSLLFLLVAISNISSAQYYYSDIITTRQTNNQYGLLKKNQIHLVSAKSYEADGQLTDNFELEQIIANNASEITTTS